MLLLLLLSCFSRVRLCATPQMAAHQAPPSLGFSRQEHWSGLPFPSPMHESEKWKWSHSVVSYSYRPHRLQPTRLLSPWDFSGKSTGVGCHCLLQTTCYMVPFVWNPRMDTTEAIVTGGPLVVARWWSWWLTAEEHEGISCNVVSVLYADCGGSYLGACIHFL